MTDRRTLAPHDWITAGFQALTAQGARGVRAEALARGLGVSKGSFYWHFADVPALEAAMLAQWEQAATDAITPDTGGTAPEAHLARLVDAVAAGGAAGRQSDAAVRDWARSNARAAQALARVDLLRLAELKHLLIAANARQPGRAARLIHAALIGMEALPRQDAEDSRKDMALLLKKLLP